MFTKDYDTLLWVGLGIFSFFTVKAVSYQFNQVRKLSEVQERRLPPCVADQDTEDALKLDTLCKLAEGSSYDLRIAAIKIICERAVVGPAFSLLLQNVASQDAQVRADALLALKFLCHSSAMPKLITLPTFHAVVTALENILKDPTWQAPPLRSPPERHAMIILRILVPNAVGLALNAGIIKRWLAFYPFMPTKLVAIKNIKEGHTDDSLMQEIISILENNPDSRKQLRIAGLMGSSWDESRDDEHPFLHTHGRPGLIDLRPHRRLMEESPEEQRLRRRRREAMVLSDGAQPLGRENIIQRRNTGPREEDSVEETDSIDDDEAVGEAIAHLSNGESPNPMPQTEEEEIQFPIGGELA